jgi:tetratricopeptide (TPR) repeat protein
MPLEVRFTLPSGKVSPGRAGLVERTESVAMPMPELTRRERDVLLALCRPLASDRPVAMPATVREIATELVVTEAAIKQHLLNLYDKFDVSEGPESRRIALARQVVLRGFANGVGAPIFRSGSSLEIGRAAAARRAWPEAFAALSEAAQTATLDVADVELLGDAATWSGQFDASTSAREQAYAAYLALDDRRSAARVAFGLGWNAAVTLRFAVVAGWLGSAGRLLAAGDDDADAPVWPEHGLMLSLMALGELAAGQTGAGLEHARAAFDVGRRTGDRDVQALGLVFEGFGLVHQGRLDDGRALLDEAMANAIAGRLGTLAQGMVYCRMLSACLDVFDYRRAIEWTETIDRRAPDLGTVGFPGDCRTHRAVICVVRGDWQLGATEAEAAAIESRLYDLGYTAQALSALGEIRRRQGDLAAAHDAFDRANEIGLPPGPGPALLLLVGGDVAAARSAIADALGVAGADPLTRARYLPAAVEISVAAGDLAGADAMHEELASIATSFPGPALGAASLDAAGAIAMARGDAAAAIDQLRTAASQWRSAGAPYETARSRLGVAMATAALGDRTGAAREARAALAVFEQLGARLEIEAATRLVTDLSAPA